MKLIMKAAEEKWLRDLYGREYEDYCKRVNRCRPWLPAKECSERKKNVATHDKAQRMPGLPRMNRRDP